MRKGEGAELEVHGAALHVQGHCSFLFQIFSWLDDVDVAEMLGIDPSPEVIGAVAERIVRRSVRDRSMHGWELSRWIGDCCLAHYSKHSFSRYCDHCIIS